MNIFIHCLLFFLSVSNATSKSTQQPLSFNDDRLIPAKLRGRRLAPSPSLSRPPAATHHLNHQPGHPPGIPPPRPPTAGHHPPVDVSNKHQSVVLPGHPVEFTPAKLRVAPPLKEFPNVAAGKKESRHVDDNYNTHGQNGVKHDPAKPANTDLRSDVSFTKALGLDIHYKEASEYKKLDAQLKKTMAKVSSNEPLLKEDLKILKTAKITLGSEINKQKALRAEAKSALAESPHAIMTRKREAELESLEVDIGLLEQLLETSDAATLKHELNPTHEGERQKIYKDRVKQAKEVGREIKKLQRQIEKTIESYDREVVEMINEALLSRRELAKNQKVTYQNLQELLKTPGMDTYKVETHNLNSRPPVRRIEMGSFNKKKHLKLLLEKDAPKDRYLKLDKSINKVLKKFGKGEKPIGEDMQYLFEDFLTVKLGADSARNEFTMSPFKKWNYEYSTAELIHKFIPDELQLDSRRKQIHEQDSNGAMLEMSGGESLDMLNTRLKTEIMEEFAAITGVGIENKMFEEALTTAQRRLMVDDIAHLSQILDLMPYAMKEFNPAKAHANAQKMADEIKLAIKHSISERLRTAELRDIGISEHMTYNVADVESGLVQYYRDGIVMPDVFNHKRTTQVLQDDRRDDFIRRYGQPHFEEKLRPLLRRTRVRNDEAGRVIQDFALKAYEDRFNYNILKRFYGETTTAVGRKAAAHSHAYPRQMENGKFEEMFVEMGLLDLKQKTNGTIKKGQSLYREINKIADEEFADLVMWKVNEPHPKNDYPDQSKVHIPMPKMERYNSKEGSIFISGFKDGFPEPKPKLHKFD